jgi:hypothetical protein
VPTLHSGEEKAGWTLLEQFSRRRGGRPGSGMDVRFSRDLGRLAGVIDFGDVSIGDPDYDLAFLAMRLAEGFFRPGGHEYDCSL